MNICILKNINSLDYEPSQENRAKLCGECIMYVFVFNWLIWIIFIAWVGIDRLCVLFCSCCYRIHEPFLKEGSFLFGHTNLGQENRLSVWYKLVSAAAKILYFKNICLAGAGIPTPVPYSLEEFILGVTT